MKNLESNRFSCPSCGGYMTYSPKEKMLLCDYCQTTMPIVLEDTLIEEYDLFEESHISHIWPQEKRSIKCSSCGGETVVDVEELTSECVFCGSKLVTEIEDEGVMPEAVLPFSVERQDAKSNIGKWLKGKFYAPKALKKSIKLERLKSLYVPFFTYDTETATDFTCQVGEYYYVTRRRNNKTVRERRIRWHHEGGHIEHTYDDILINASNKVDEGLINRMNSFDLEELQAYHNGFVVGHIAERYGMNLMSGWERAKQYIRQDLNNRIRHKVGGDEVKNIRIAPKYDQVRYKHILLPVWITHYYFKDKLYNVYINGQNGRVVGSYPKSLGKILLTLVAIAIIVFGIYYVSVQGRIF